MACPEVLLEQRLEALDVGIAALAPAIARGIGHILDFKLGDGGFGVVDARAHTISRLGTAMTNRPPH
ncbi:hypothetical protein D3C76_1426450 [compost metagenome]